MICIFAMFDRLADSRTPGMGGETTPSCLEGIDHPNGREGLNVMRAILLSGALATVCSLLGTRIAIGWFARHGFGQPIRHDGPTTHHVKRGTPSTDR